MSDVILNYQPRSYLMQSVKILPNTSVIGETKQGLRCEHKCII